MNAQRIFVSLITVALLFALVVGLTQAQAPDPQRPLAPQVSFQNVGAALAVARCGQGQALPLPRIIEKIPPQAALGTGFTYQGQLKKDGQPVSGDCEMAFRLYEDANTGSQVGSPITRTVTISDGLFTEVLDFGSSAFDGNPRWLGIVVNCGDVSFSELGRQAITAAPYALYAGSVPWSGLANVPAGFADNVDNVSVVVSGTNIYAGEGLDELASGNEITLSIASTYRLPQACDDGQLTKWNGATWQCADENGGNVYTAGYGLSLDSNTFNVVTSTVQARVNGVCGADYAIRQVNDDGSVTCEPTGGGGGDDWALTGNAGTDPSTNFLGTTDNVTLTLRVSNTAALRLIPNAVSPNLIGGYSGNWVTSGAYGAAIGGGGGSGAANRVTDNYGTVGGGYNNQAGDNAGATSDGEYATIGGGSTNIASGAGATVSGGGWNSISSNGNQAMALASTIGGGYGNLITTTANYATIGGGMDNAASGLVATIGGGEDNTASGNTATIGGGVGNAASGNTATIGGGVGNAASGVGATIGGGWNNTASGYAATVGGGSTNTASGEYATVPGGYRAAADHYGQMAYASGGFANAGDAQASLYVMRRSTTMYAGDWHDLYLDGSSAFLTIAPTRTLTFDILLVGRTEAGESAGYRIAGVIENVGGTTAFIGAPTITVLGEDDTAWDAQVIIDNNNDALQVYVMGNGEEIRWVATVRTAEVAW